MGVTIGEEELYERKVFPYEGIKVRRVKETKEQYSYAVISLINKENVSHTEIFEYEPHLKTAMEVNDGKTRLSYFDDGMEKRYRGVDFTNRFEHRMLLDRDFYRMYAINKRRYDIRIMNKEEIKSDIEFIRCELERDIEKDYKEYLHKKLEQFLFVQKILW